MHDKYLIQYDGGTNADSFRIIHPNSVAFKKQRIIYRSLWHRLLCFLGIPQREWEIELRFQSVKATVIVTE